MLKSERLSNTWSWVNAWSRLLNYDQCARLDITVSLSLSIPQSMYTPWRKNRDIYKQTLDMSSTWWWKQQNMAKLNNFFPAYSLSSQVRKEWWVKNGLWRLQWRHEYKCAALSTELWQWWWIYPASKIEKFHSEKVHEKSWEFTLVRKLDLPDWEIK